MPAKRQRNIAVQFDPRNAHSNTLPEGVIVTRWPTRPTSFNSRGFEFAVMTPHGKQRIEAGNWIVTDGYGAQHVIERVAFIRQFKEAYANSVVSRLKPINEKAG